MFPSSVPVGKAFIIAGGQCCVNTHDFLLVLELPQCAVCFTAHENMSTVEEPHPCTITFYHFINFRETYFTFSSINVG